MKKMMIGGLSALVALMAGRGFAQDVAWRPAGSTPAFQRVQPAAATSITLSRPVPAISHDTDPSPATWTERSAPVFRAKTMEPEDLHLLMPVGPGPDTSKQPGSAKPIGSPEKIQKMPRAADSFVAPSPQFLQSSPGVTYLDSKGSPIHGGGILDDCPPCDAECGSCVSDVCGPGWGHRFRKWNAGWCEDACCPPRPGHWIRAEYLLWNVTDQNLPPLLTTELAPSRGPDGAGILPRSPILFDEGDAEESVRSGGRVQLGFWFPRHGKWGMDGSFFVLARRNFTFQQGSDATGFPVLARPFLEANTGTEAAQLVSFPGLLAGNFSYSSTTRLYGGDAHFRRKLHCGPRWWLDGFIGYRYLSLADTIDINESLQVIDPAQGLNGFRVNDHFATRNIFNGPQVGIEGEVKFLRRWFLAGNVKVAVGNVHQIVNIDGSTEFLAPGGGVSAVGRGGLFALNSNIGKHERAEFAVVTEFGIKVGFDVTDHLRVYAGYNLLYLSDAVRAGDQIDRVVNVNLLPEPTNLNPALVAPARPGVLFRASDFWAQGGQFGIEYHW